jgi:hypothetical protein
MKISDVPINGSNPINPLLQFHCLHKLPPLILISQLETMNSKKSRPFKTILLEGP